MLLAHQDRKLIRAIHRYQRYRDKAGLIAWLGCTWGKLGYMFWTVISSSDIHRDARIDASVRFPHLTGVVIHQDAVIAEGCLIMQQVTLGQTADAGAPRLGRNVYIGAGAKILGNILIADNARVGANAVVLSDVPKNATVVGIPAKIK